MAITSTNGLKSSMARAIRNAAVGSKRAAGISAMSAYLGVGWRIVIRRTDGTPADKLVLIGSGLLPTGTSCVITASNIASTELITTTDLDTGTFVVRITNQSGSEYVEGTAGRSSADFILTNDIDSSAGATLGTITMTLPSALDGGATATPPGTVADADWIVRSTDAPVVVPSTFLGLHSDYVSGSSMANPNVQSYVGTHRSWDHDPDVTGASNIAWAKVELTAGNYTWTKLDAWVNANSGKQLIYVLGHTPSFYAKYYSSYSAYGSGLPYSPSPPTDWNKAADFLIALLNKHSTENIIIELWNEPSFPWDTTAMTGDASRWTDAKAASLSTSGKFYVGTPSELATGAKVIRTRLNAAGKSAVKLFGPGAESDGTNYAASPTTNDQYKIWNAPCDGGGVGRDYLDAYCYHIYEYASDVRNRLPEIRAYNAAAAAIAPGKPKHMTEGGFITGWGYNQSDTVHSDNVVRLSFMLAALGAQSCCWYQCDSDNVADNLKYWATESTQAKIDTNAAFRSAMQTAAGVNGKTIVQACLTTDGGTKKVWLAYSDGTTALR